MKNIMSIQITDLDGGIGVLIVGQGIVTDEEYVQAFTKHLTQDAEKFKKYRYSLSDYTAVDKALISSEAIQKIAKLSLKASAINPQLIIATASRQDLIYGLSRMSQLLTDRAGWLHSIFRKREEAESWLKEIAYQKFGLVDLTFR